jgi:hypothetical protein
MEKIMKLELSLEEARFLKRQLDRHIEELDNELVHTDKRALQHALAEDVEHLKSIERKLARLIEAADVAA